MSDQQEEEVLRRRAREQAEIERQTDALVLHTLTTLVTASEELKSKLRRDTESLLEGYRRSKRQLESEISRTTAERLRSRREAEQERPASGTSPEPGGIIHSVIAGSGAESPGPAGSVPREGVPSTASPGSPSSRGAGL